MSAAAKTSDSAVTYRARWVIPVDQPPLAGGTVTIAERRIVSVGQGDVGGPVRDLGDVAILPGLVNAHTHLEFSLLTQPLGHAAMSFAEWIRLVVEHRRQEAKTLMVETDGFQRFRRRAAQSGLKELAACGTVAVGDVATPGWPRECFPAESIHATVFLELLGLDPAREDGLFAMGQSFVLDLLDKPGKMWPGLSPHAPYTASPRLVERVCQLSRQERFPVAMHLAESREELELLASHTGPLVQTLEALGAWHPATVPLRTRPLEYLRLLAAARRALVIHGNYLAADEIQFLAAERERMSVVYCPRTHAYFNHPSYPLAELLKAGVRVALGTDSRASNPDLNLWEELRRVARQHPSVAPEDILRMGTLSGAEALGLKDYCGSITPGKSGRLAVVPLAADGGAPIEALLLSESVSTPLLGKH